MRGYIPPVDEEERLFFRRIVQQARAVQARGGAYTTAFLSDRQQVLARAALSSADFADYTFFGGYDGAERCVLRLFGACDAARAPEDFPIACVFAECRNRESGLTHRDYLGALLSLGIKRECLGDILPAEQGACVFVLERVASLVCGELVRVGRFDVCARAVQPEELPQQEARPVQTASVASLRLDAVLAAMLRCSRADAAGLIRGGMVEVNHIPVHSAHYEVYENDHFSIRGHGKYRLCGIGAQSRKGRTFVSYLVY